MGIFFFPIRIRIILNFCSFAFEALSFLYFISYLKYLGINIQAQTKWESFASFGLILDVVSKGD